MTVGTALLLLLKIGLLWLGLRIIAGAAADMDESMRSK